MNATQAKNAKRMKRINAVVERRSARRLPKPVTVEQVKQLVLRALIAEFDGRDVDVDVLTEGLSAANMHIKQTYVFAPREKAK